MGKSIGMPSHCAGWREHRFIAGECKIDLSTMKDPSIKGEVLQARRRMTTGTSL